jgi:hypothetical protein
MMARLHRACRKRGSWSASSRGPEATGGAKRRVPCPSIAHRDDSSSMRSVVKKIVGLSGVGVNQLLEAENGRRASKSWAATGSMPSSSTSTCRR